MIGLYRVTPVIVARSPSRRRPTSPAARQRPRRVAITDAAVIPERAGGAARRTPVTWTQRRAQPPHGDRRRRPRSTRAPSSRASEFTITAPADAGRLRLPLPLPRVHPRHAHRCRCVSLDGPGPGARSAAAPTLDGHGPRRRRRAPRCTMERRVPGAWEAGGRRRPPTPTGAFAARRARSSRRAPRSAPSPGDAAQPQRPRRGPARTCIVARPGAAAVA